MKKTMLRAFVGFCVATVITQLILLIYFAFVGSLSRETGVKVVGLLNGIDISGARLQQVLKAAEDREQPDFEEILESRRREGMNMDLRIRSQQQAKNELSEALETLIVETTVMDARVESFNEEKERVKAGFREEGALERQRTIQALEPDAAKDQLLRIYDDDKIDEVVNIIQDMPIDKRQEILAEFETDADKDKLYEILRRIGDGLPMTKLIDEAGMPK